MPRNQQKNGSKKSFNSRKPQIMDSYYATAIV